MTSAAEARAFLQEDPSTAALDGVTDFIPLRRSLQRLRADKQLQAWVRYADQLETRLGEVYEELSALRRHCDVQRIVYQRSDDATDDPRLELMARVRAEQLMNVRLLKLLARCADLDMLSDPEGEAAAVLDVKRRRELRAWDFEESVAEHEALLQAKPDGLLRMRDGRGATRLTIPGAWHDMG